MSTTHAQRVAVRAAREVLAEIPDASDNEEPYYWIGRLRAAVGLLLDAYDPAVPWAGEAERIAAVLNDPHPPIRWPVPEDEPACGRCGATREHGVIVTADGVTRCYNRPLCAGRVRDAEAAQVKA